MEKWRLKVRDKEKIKVGGWRWNEEEDEFLKIIF